MTDRILVTCPPMLAAMDALAGDFLEFGFEPKTLNIIQTATEAELCEQIVDCDGWIIGDDPATEQVLRVAVGSGLKAAVKWGVGTDNVDFEAASALGLPVKNTPGMFNDEVADTAIAYLIGLARSLFVIDRQVRAGQWPKRAGQSLRGKTLALVGYGNIGRAIAARAAVMGVEVIVYDPGLAEDQGIVHCQWPEGLDKADFVIFCCALTDGSFHMLNHETIKHLKPGVVVVNVSRGSVIQESALIEAVEQQIVSSFALDVMEVEPLPVDSPLRHYECGVFGSHNASNTQDAVLATSKKALRILRELMDGTN